MTDAAVWLIAGLAVAAAEMLTPGFFLIWVGLAMLGTGLAALAADLSWHGQLGLFVALMALVAGWAAYRVRRRPAPDLVNAPAAGLVGRRAEAEAFRGGVGRVRLADGAWLARTDDGSDPLPGQALLVTGLEGTTLRVAPCVPQDAVAHGIGPVPS